MKLRFLSDVPTVWMLICNVCQNSILGGSLLVIINLFLA